MAQTIKLKRSSTQGKVPTTSQLALGEIAINTYDGRIFFEKNDGSATIEQIVTTDSVTTGSITITGTTQTGTLTTTNRIDKQYLDDEVLNTSLNTFTGSAITITGNGTSGSVAVFNNTHEVTNASINSLDSGTTITHGNDGNIIFTISGSNGELLTVTDSNSGNLLEVNDSSGIDVFTVSATGDVSASGAITASGVTGLTSLSVAGTTQTTTLTTTNRIDKQYLDDEVLNTSLNAATSSYLTGHPSISQGSNISQNNSNGTVLQDLTITLDSNGHVTTATAGTVNLDGRYYTETESDTLFTKKLGQGVISGSSQITSFGNLEIANPTITGTLVSEDVVRFTGLSSATEATSVMINGSNELVTRELGSNAFTSTTITPDGGNADQVDGLHASSFIRSDATDTATGALTFTGDSKFTGQTNFQIMGDSNAIFMSSSATYDPSNDTGKLYLGGYQSGNTRINGLIFDYEEPAIKIDLDLQTNSQIDMTGTTQSTSKTTGILKVAGGVGIAKTLNVGEDVVAYASSDERYKDLITPIENPNEKIKLLSGNTFVWNDKHEVFKGKKDIGVIAQEVEKVLPEIVETRDNGYKAVKYEKIVALLIESNKELIKRVEELESKLK